MPVDASQPLGLGDKARLTAEVAAAYVQVRWLLKRRDLPTTLKTLRDGGAGPEGQPPTHAQESGPRLARSVLRTLPRLPIESRCLVRSLVLTRLLARRGIPGALVIGVEPGEKFGAHAWVEVGGRALLDPGGDRFGRLVEL